MIRTFLSAVLCTLLLMPISATSVPLAVEAVSPEKIVVAFQKLPPYEIDCRDETMGSTEPIKVGAKFEVYLSKEFYRLFLWEKCGEPEPPPHDKSSRTDLTWDIRFGNNNGSLGTNEVENIRIKSVKFHGSDKAIIKLLFDVPIRKDIISTYTLIREDGYWKIDDIAPKGDVPNSYGDTALEHSASIKTDMQTNYRAAEERYQKEQAQKSVVPKP